MILGGASAGGQLAATVAFSVVHYDRSLRRRAAKGLELGEEQQKIAFGPRSNVLRGERRPRGIRGLLLFGAVTALSVQDDGQERERESRKAFDRRFDKRGEEADNFWKQDKKEKGKETVEEGQERKKRGLNIFESGAQTVADWFLSDGLLGGQDSGEYLSPMHFLKTMIPVEEDEEEDVKDGDEKERESSVAAAVTRRVSCFSAASRQQRRRQRRTKNALPFPTLVLHSENDALVNLHLSLSLSCLSQFFLFFFFFILIFAC